MRAAHLGRFNHRWASAFCECIKGFLDFVSETADFIAIENKKRGKTQNWRKHKITKSTAEAKVTSIEPESRPSPPQTNWDDAREPGAYVDQAMGDLYRMPKEALVAGASPIVMKESRSSTRLLARQRTPSRPYKEEILISERVRAVAVA